MSVKPTLPQTSLGLFILLAILASITLGIFQRVSGSLPWLSVIYPLGSIFVSMLRMIIGPLVFLAVLTGILQISQIQGMGRIGLMTCVYYITTTLIAITIGIMAVTFFHPGEGINLSSLVPEDVRIGTAPEVGSFFIEILKAILVNPVKALTETNILALVMHAVLIGLAVNQLGEHGQVIRNIVTQLYQALQKIISWILWIAPIGIFAIMLRLIVETGTDLLEPL